MSVTRTAMRKNQSPSNERRPICWFCIGFYFVFISFRLTPRMFLFFLFRSARLMLSHCNFFLSIRSSWFFWPSASPSQFFDSSPFLCLLELPNTSDSSSLYSYILPKNALLPRRNLLHLSFCVRMSLWHTLLSLHPYSLFLVIRFLFFYTVISFSYPRHLSALLFSFSILQGAFWLTHHLPSLCFSCSLAHFYAPLFVASTRRQHASA